MAISCIDKSVRKLRNLQTEGKNFHKHCALQTCWSSSHTKWPTYVYMLFVPKGRGHMFIDLARVLPLLGLGLIVYWLCES